MADERISEYAIEEALLLSDFDLMDVSVLVSTGPDVFDSRSVPNSLIKGVNILAFAPLVNLGALGVGAETSLTWNAAVGKTVTPTFLRLRHRSGGIKDLSDITIQIGSATDTDDILKATTLLGYIVDGSYIVNIMGALPEMLSVTDTFFFKVLVGAQADVNESDVFIHGPHTDV